MFLNKAVIKRANDPNALFVFLHSQRTGGSNTQRWLRRLFGDDKVYSSQLVDDFVHWENLRDLAPLAGYRAFCGFSRYARPDAGGRPLVYISNVRHPFYRAVSIYGMSRHHTTHFLHPFAIAHSFEDFYRLGSAEKPGYFHNLACVRIGGAPDAEAAIETMRRDFALVASTNQLHEGTAALLGALGWDAKPMAAGGAPRDEINYRRWDESPVRDEIMANNEEDLKLFAFVTANDPPLDEFDEARPPRAPSDDEKATGRARLARLARAHPIAPDMRVIDYGCQPRALGAALVERLDPGHYLGLAAGIPGAITIVDPALTDKRARIEQITAANIEAARSFGADLIVAMDLLFRTSPERIDKMLADLAGLAGKPNAALMINAWISEKRPIEYKKRSWTWPEHMLKEKLGALGMAPGAIDRGHRREVDGEPMTNTLLCFTRSS